MRQVLNSTPGESSHCRSIDEQNKWCPRGQTSIATCADTPTRSSHSQRFSWLSSTRVQSTVREVNCLAPSTPVPVKTRVGCHPTIYHFRHAKCRICDERSRSSQWRPACHEPSCNVDAPSSPDKCFARISKIGRQAGGTGKHQQFVEQNSCKWAVTGMIFHVPPCERATYSTKCRRRVVS